MNNQLDNTIVLHPPDMSIDPVEEALSHLSHLSKERRKKAAIQLLNQLHLADRTEIAQETGIFSVNHLYRCMPKERLRVVLSTSPEQMEAMLCRANQGLLSTAITVEQLWDRHCMNWIEVRRLEMELGAGGDHDVPYTWSLPPTGSHVLAWTKLLARCERGEFES